jgi:hypothetical protein
MRIYHIIDNTNLINNIVKRICNLIILIIVWNMTILKKWIQEELKIYLIIKESNTYNKIVLKKIIYKVHRSNYLH